MACEILNIIDIQKDFKARKEEFWRYESIWKCLIGLCEYFIKKLHDILNIS